jgi:hypothetical protein
MQTDRVTFLTSRDHKMALDAFASGRNESVGHVLREASVQYMAQPAQRDEYEEALEMVLPELEAAFAKWNLQFDSMHASLDRAIAAVDRALEGDAA